MKRTFVDRHIGPSQEQIATMVHELGFGSLDELISKVLPPTIVLSEKFGATLPQALSEEETIVELRKLATKNTILDSMIGMGYYGTITPPVVLRNVLENPAWYTAYTPYQPEIKIGRAHV